MDDRFDAGAKDIADHERAIQRDIDAKDARKGDQDRDSGAVQAGARLYPEPPFPEQHQTKPGDEAALDPAPMYDAPFWKGSGKLEGFAALITGADSGIGRSVAVLFAREGCDVVICHLDEDADAETTRIAVEAEGRRASVCAVFTAQARGPGPWRVQRPGPGRRRRPHAAASAGRAGRPD